MTAAPATTYTYQVYAYNANGSSTPVISGPVTTPDVAPNAPSNLAVVNLTSTSVSLAWTDNAINETGFIVERSDNAGDTWDQLGQTLAADTVVFSDDQVAPASSYLYRVYADNTIGPSGGSNEVAVTTPSGTPPAAPSNLVVTNHTVSSLTLNWQDNSGTSKDGFIVQIALDKNFTRSLQTVVVAANETSFSFFPLAPNTKYFFRVAAFNAAGSSAWAPMISDKTLR